MTVFGHVRKTPLSRLDPRARLCLVAASAAMVCSAWHPPVLMAAAALSLLLLGAARPPLGTVLRRLLPLNLFLLLLAVSLPLSCPGTPLVSVAGLTWSRDGILRAGVVAWRANTIMVAVVALLGDLDPGAFARSLRGLGAPATFSQVIYLMARYVDVVHREYDRLRDAMRCRGFQPACSWHTCRTYGFLVGQLLVRSAQRADRTLEAMKCRGFNGHFPDTGELRWTPGDTVAMVLGGVVLSALAVWEMIA